MRIKWFSLIRISGLLLVLLYHFYPESYRGGFVGVDLFFTFSGYLVTALFCDEFYDKGYINVGSFYRRRLFRIYPPLLLTILLCLPFTYLVSHDYLTELPQQVVSALSFTTNLFEIQNGGSYEAQFIPHLFVHTWSLALEVQFYVLWAIVVGVLAKHCRHFSGTIKNQTTYLRLSIFLISLILAITSYVTMVVRSSRLTEFSPVYFSSIAHSFPFFIGSLLASINGIKRVPQRFKRKAQQQQIKGKSVGIFTFSLIGLLILAKQLTFASQSTYYFGILLASLLTGSMILSARMLHEKNPEASEPKVFVFLANISYGVYLFHWPLYVIFTNRWSHSQAVLATISLSIVFSMGSFYIVEPLLAGKDIVVLKKKLTPSQLKYGILLLLPLVGNLFFLISQAPQMSTLEKDLWLSNVQQDVDRLQMAREGLEQKEASDYTFPKGTSIIGDSVILGARDYLMENIPDSFVDGEVSRNLDRAYEVMIANQEENVLREYVVIGIGNNPQYDYEEQAVKIVEDLAAGHHLIFVVPYDDSSKLSELVKEQGEYYKKLAQKYDYVTICDWAVVARAHPEIYEDTDGIHFGSNQEGNELFTKTLLAALQEAEGQPRKE